MLYLHLLPFYDVLCSAFNTSLKKDMVIWQKILTLRSVYRDLAMAGIPLKSSTIILELMTLSGNLELSSLWWLSRITISLKQAKKDQREKEHLPELHCGVLIFSVFVLLNEIFTKIIGDSHFNYSFTIHLFFCIWNLLKKLTWGLLQSNANLFFIFRL